MTDYLSRFESKWELDPNSDCWVWLAGDDGILGYGKFHHEGMQSLAHRVSWKLYKGEIPKGVLVLHTCDRPYCVNPNHLYLGSHGDNLMDSWDRGRRMNGRTKDHCVNGHPLSGDNLLVERDGHRRCKVCTQARNRQAWEKRKLARA